MSRVAGETGSRRLDVVGPEESLRSVATALVLSMPPERRAVLVLATQHKLSYPEIAERLGLTVDAIKLHMREGLTSVHQNVRAQLAVLGRPQSERGAPGGTVDEHLGIVAST